MSFLSNLKKVLHLGANDGKKKKVYNNIQMDCDPKEHWEMFEEIGYGAFGVVYKVNIFNSINKGKFIFGIFIFKLK